MILKKNTKLGKIKLLFFFLTFFLYFINSSYSDDLTLEGNFLEIKVLDKVSSKNYKLNIKIGEDLFIIGYPSVGGKTLTITKGIISGFLDSYIKTDAEINSGNSGGLVLNCNYEIIGMATAITYDKIGKIGLIKPISILGIILKLFE